jgi:hypothetical protein
MSETAASYSIRSNFNEMNVAITIRIIQNVTI